MTPSEFIILFVLLAVIFYWVDTIFAKEIACKHGKDKCEALGVTFLDATVEITKTRLKRSSNGTIKFKRDYSFEFSSDGVRRYTGNISMLGKVLMDLNMSAYPEAVTASIAESENTAKEGATFESKVVNITEASDKKGSKNKLPTGFR